jgi:predicted kinase
MPQMGCRVARLLSQGSDVVLRQYLAHPDFIEELEALATRSGATFVEVVMELDAPALATRLARRSEISTRPEHAINNTHVGPAAAEALVASIHALRSRSTKREVDRLGQPGDDPRRHPSATDLRHPLLRLSVHGRSTRPVGHTS